MSIYDDLSDPTLRIPVPDAQAGDGLPRIWWRYGAPPSQAGFFYSPASAWPTPLPDPWVEEEVFQGEAGWVTRSLELCVVLKRAQPYRKVQVGGKVWRAYAPRWEPGMQIHTEVLCLIRGVDTPAVWSYHGATGAVAENCKDGIWATATRLLATEASRRARRPVSLSAFWVLLGPTLDSRGKPVFARLTQGATLNHVALRLPDAPAEELPARQYVGREILERVVALQEEYADWARQRRGDAVPTGEEPPAPANGAVAAEEDMYDESAPF